MQSSLPQVHLCTKVLVDPAGGGDREVGWELEVGPQMPQVLLMGDMAAVCELRGTVADEGTGQPSPLSSLSPGAEAVGRAWGRGLISLHPTMCRQTKGGPGRGFTFLASSC